MGGIEIDNLRAAFDWSRETSDLETALRLMSVVTAVLVKARPLPRGAGWVRRHPGQPAPRGITPEVWARAVADHSTVAASIAIPASLDRTQDALAIARQLDDPALITQALIACGMLASTTPSWPSNTSPRRSIWPARPVISPACAQILTTWRPGVSLPANRSPHGRPPKKGVTSAMRSAISFLLVDGRTWLSATLWLQGDLAQAAESPARWPKKRRRPGI